MKSFKNFLDQFDGLEENYRALAQKGIGAESKKEIKVGHGVDYYHPKSGDKHMGKIHSMSDKGYVVKDDKTGEKHSFDYYRKEEVKEEVESTVAENYETFKKSVADSRAENNKRFRELVALRAKKDAAKKEPQGSDFAEKRRKERLAANGRMDEESELDEADFSKSQTVMAHAIGKHLKKKGVGDESKGGPYAVASAMVRDKPSAAKKAYATIKSKTQNEDHQDVLMALYDELNEDNKEIFEDMLDSNPEKLISFAMSQVSKE